MSHAIHYTSAPEGLRPGQRGFCTVAATDGLPRPLWDRLESVSSYRHEFSAGGGGRNPVAWAHQLLSVQGRDVSVLSRICDSGLDYTQRTNFFAHHIALDPAERAAGGPAFMLQRGPMASSWNGQIGTITPPSLPIGDVRPGVCSTWQRLAGDAGWAGVLAEAAIKQPRRVACIVYSADQDVLPLIAEAIALLPAAKRWDVTFNTYFTGLPGNVVCAWRCCLAGTPAAADAMRHAAAGLVFDLTRPMGAPPASTWVEAARTGRPPTEAAAVAPRKAPPLPKAAAVAPVEEEDPEPLDLMPVEAEAGERPRSIADVFQRMQRPPRAVEATGEARAVDTAWVDHQASSRRWLLIGVIAVALLFIAAGVWLKMSAQQQTAERPLELTRNDEEPATRVVITPVEPPPPVRVIPVEPPPPATQEVVEPPPVVTPPTTTVAPPPPPPALIRLPAEVLLPATTGAALKAPTQSVSIPAAEFDNLPAVASFKIVFPGKSASYTYRQKDLAGVLSAEASGGFRYNLMWRDDTNKNVPLDVASVGFEPIASGATLEIAWRMKAVLQRPEVISLVRVLLTNADLVVADAANRRPQTMKFKPADTFDLLLTTAVTPVALTTLPDAMFRPEKALAGGWTMVWSAGPATRTSSADAEVGTLHFERPHENGGTPAKFAVRIAPRWSALHSDFSVQHATARQALMNADAAVAKAEAEIQRMREGQIATLKPLRERLAEAEGQLKLTDKQLSDLFTNRPALRERIKAERMRLEELRDAIDADISQAVTRKEPLDVARLQAAETLKAYDDWQPAVILVELPGKLRVATVRMRAK